MTEHGYPMLNMIFQYFSTRFSVVSCNCLLLNLEDFWINVISLYKGEKYP